MVVRLMEDFILCIIYRPSSTILLIRSHFYPKQQYIQIHVI